MKQIPLYTIGYGAGDMAAFLAVLRAHHVAYLIAVRSKPYSRYKPEFSKPAVESHLPVHGGRYVFMGDTLGGQPDDPDCYTDGKVDYHKVYQQPLYQTGISRLRDALQQQLRVAVMCSEGKPEHCHRSRLSGVSLVAEGIGVALIDENDQLLTQEAVRGRLHQGQSSLFGAHFHQFTSRKRYERET